MLSCCARRLDRRKDVRRGVPHKRITETKKSYERLPDEDLDLCRECVLFRSIGNDATDTHFLVAYEMDIGSTTHQRLHKSMIRALSRTKLEHSVVCESLFDQCGAMFGHLAGI